MGDSNSYIHTCPGTWSLIGEHAFRYEAPLNASRRGIKEEVDHALLILRRLIQVSQKYD
jgi:hypothetical protein